MPKPIDPLKDQEQAEEHLEKVEQELSGFERATLRWTKATFGIVAATGVFIWLQWCEMRSGGKDTHDLAVAAGKQTDAAERAAHDADESLKRNTEAFKLDEQARIRIKTVEIGWDRKTPGDPLVANYIYVNVGKIPAEVLEIDKHVALIASRKDMDTVTFQPTRPVKVPYTLQIFTGDEPSFSAMDYSLLESAEGPSATQGKKVVVSWGCIQYRDLFGDAHWTDFCYVRQPPPNDRAYAVCDYKCQR